MNTDEDRRALISYRMAEICLEDGLEAIRNADEFIASVRTYLHQ